MLVYAVFVKTMADKCHRILKLWLINALEFKLMLINAEMLKTKLVNAEMLKT